MRSARLLTHYVSRRNDRFRFYFEPLPVFELFVEFLLLSLTVVFGFLCTVDCLTKRPVIALRPR